ncbi:MAG TPA: hypothetical protein VL595_30535, partial [Pseudonocardia sp.]|nr:hypothetical protein [Pseudonocardia sp.]
MAESFVDAMRRFGLPIYLAGGAALHMQGGHRPIHDLDFQVPSREAGFTDFGAAKGRQVLEYLNNVWLAGELKNYHRNVNRGLATRNGKIDLFSPIGWSSSPTIGTGNWLGHEVSLSVVARRPEVVSPSTGPGINVLSLADLQADKAKTAISRKKYGEESVKKVAQDLYDFLDATDLLDQRSRLTWRGGADGGQNMYQHARRALAARRDDYRVSNLDGGNLHHLSAEDLSDLMLGRLVLTAQAHVKHGSRRDAFQDLLPYGSPRLGERLEALASLPVAQRVRDEFRPWMSSWNDRTSFGPPPRSQRFKAPARQQSDRLGMMPPEEDEPRVEPPPVHDLLELYADDVVDRLETVLPRASEDIRQMVRVLVFSDDHFRELRNSHRDSETQHAFGLTKSKFGKAYSALANARLVQASEAGLRLSDEGREILVPRDGASRVVWGGERSSGASTEDFAKRRDTPYDLSGRVRGRGGSGEGASRGREVPWSGDRPSGAAF